MNLILSVEDANHLAASRDPLPRDLVKRAIEARQRFVEKLSEYSGSREAFPWIVREAVAGQEVTLSDIANALEINATTVARWARGSAPSTLARVEAVKRLRALLGVKLDQLSTAISEAPKTTATKKAKRARHSKQGPMRAYAEPK